MILQASSTENPPENPDDTEYPHPDDDEYPQDPEDFYEDIGGCE